MSIVLALASLDMGSNTPFVREDKARPVIEVNALRFLQCFGWVTERTSAP